ncbi:MAG: ABC transporter substrate-binding protein [Janthinobacterium lividum]
MAALVGASLFAWLPLAHAADPIKIGAVYSISGAGSFLGVPEERALKMRVDQLNQAGGINGHKIELTVYDTEGNTTKAAQQFRRLVDSDQVQVVFGPSSSGESLQVLPIANELKVPVIMHAGTEKVINPITPYAFNTAPTDRIVAGHLLSIFKKRGQTTVALMSSADGFGQSGANVLNELAPQYGITIKPQETFNRQDQDFTAQMLHVKDSPAQAVLVWSAFPAPTIILKNAAAIGYKKPMYNSYAAASDDLITQGGAAAEGTYVSSMRLLAPESLKSDDPIRPVVLKLYNDFKAQYHVAPASFAAHSYDAMLIVEAAVKSINGEVTRDKLRAAIENVTVTGANGVFRLSPSAHGLVAGSQSMVLLVDKGGKWKVDE